MIRFICD